MERNFEWISRSVGTLNIIQVGESPPPPLPPKNPGGRRSDIIDDYEDDEEDYDAAEAVPVKVKGKWLLIP